MSTNQKLIDQHKEDIDALRKDVHSTQKSAEEAKSGLRAEMYVSRVMFLHGSNQTFLPSGESFLKRQKAWQNSWSVQEKT
mmetsp:Transcript_52180/g.131007  ORF Transcript_52180/g.131007 Transcript_52180/m.131007 type:complete len:80 (-) Transcript_52180:494-733(-)